MHPVLFLTILSTLFLDIQLYSLFSRPVQAAAGRQSAGHLVWRCSPGSTRGGLSAGHHVLSRGAGLRCVTLAYTNLGVLKGRLLSSLSLSDFQDSVD